VTAAAAPSLPPLRKFTFCYDVYVSPLFAEYDDNLLTFRSKNNSFTY